MLTDKELYKGFSKEKMADIKEKPGRCSEK
jgi:hypothetical protein